MPAFYVPDKPLRTLACWLLLLLGISKVSAPRFSLFYDFIINMLFQVIKKLAVITAFS